MKKPPQAVKPAGVNPRHSRTREETTVTVRYLVVNESYWA